MATEPILRKEDHELWEIWQRTALAHSRTQAYKRRVDRARALAIEALSAQPDAAVMWSCGKDSTALLHLVCVELGARVRVYAEKDDLDYPGELDYAHRLARQWDLDLEILSPPVSPAQWIADNGHELQDCSDVHSRAAGLSKACFYNVVEAANARHDLVFLGLRAEESEGRRMNRIFNGVHYYKQPSKLVPRGIWTSTPIADWKGIDVFAYLAERDVEILPVYRCIALMHASEPWRVRKSWWIPGSHSRFGGAVWLRHYYPSLFRQLVQWIPAVSTVG